MQATAHIDFILAAYGAGIVVIGALIAWVTLDYRAQRLTLTELEMQGVSRRSVTARPEPASVTAKEDA
ncbi:MAG TPA: heme exporter protein CcmD [Xanthobacteraceae bacterium]